MNGLVPQKWHEVFGKVLAKRPDDRYQTATEFDFGSYTPSKDGWGNGDREVACFLVRTDSGTMTQSYKAATQ